MTLSTFLTFLAFLTFGFGSCRVAEARDHEDGRPRYPSTGRSTLLFFGAPTPERSERSERWCLS
jgi:hypothetical protein